jgi:CBS domain-containing protein
MNEEENTMRVADIMTRNVTCCAPDMNLRDVARLMVELDCGAVPVVDEMRSKRPIGIVTDRDITCKAVARGKNPLEMQAKDVMSEGCVTVTAETSLDDCCAKMEENQIRRIVVVDKDGACCGIVAQADVAIEAPAHDTAEVVKRVSEPSAAGPLH